MNSTQQGYGWEEVTDKETGWKICREEIVEGDDTKGRRLYRVTETSPEGVATVTHESIIAEWDETPPHRAKTLAEAFRDFPAINHKWD